MASSNAVTKQIHVTVQSATLYLGVHRQKKLQYKRFCIFFVSFFPTFIKTSSTRIWISLKLHFFCTNWPFTHTKPFKLLTETTYFDTVLHNGLIHTIFGEKICSFKNVWIHVGGHRLSSIFAPLLSVFSFTRRRSKVSKIRSAASIYAHTPVCACTVEIWKKTFYIS